ncbi:hypothetical protein I7I51_05403 [Histoplasma capsulatum]|uniref:Uncharacterized protein n=1 Tax=Ajellomyces capsulatus TaxID=5037 RepID=A0A8A1M805_AJECA|nr:hypothetical protein I7I51_05403 [Histoplasma capsulatum]
MPRLRQATLRQMAESWNNRGQASAQRLGAAEYDDRLRNLIQLSGQMTMHSEYGQSAWHNHFSKYFPGFLQDEPGHEQGSTSPAGPAIGGFRAAAKRDFAEISQRNLGIVKLP